MNDPISDDTDFIDHVTSALGIDPASLEYNELADLLLQTHRRLFSSPPPPDAPSMSLSREARVKLLALRHANGVALWHKGDIIRGNEQTDFIGRKASRCRNGAVVENGLCRILLAPPPQRETA